MLAIDDEQDALTLLRVVLETAGADVTICSHRRLTALERIETLKPDVLVVDLGMHEIDGFEFIARIRRRTDPEDAGRAGRRR